MSALERIPLGYYAVPLCDDELGTIGYQVFQRKRASVSAVTTHQSPGADPAAVREDELCFADLLALVAQDPDWYREEYGRFAGKCGRCGRTLTDPDSKARGIGPECRRRGGG